MKHQTLEEKFEKDYPNLFENLRTLRKNGKDLLADILNKAINTHIASHILPSAFLIQQAKSKLYTLNSFSYNELKLEIGKYAHGQIKLRLKESV